VAVAEAALQVELLEQMQGTVEAMPLEQMQQQIEAAVAEAAVQQTLEVTVDPVE